MVEVMEQNVLVIKAGLMDDEMKNLGLRQIVIMKCRFGKEKYSFYSLYTTSSSQINIWSK